MAIPEFTECGLLPAGVHDCTIPEIASRFCLNEHRSERWNGFLAFLTWAAPLPAAVSYLIDGSFVSDKALPNDVDLAVDITRCDDAAQSAWVDAWVSNCEKAKENFRVDFYPFAVGQGHDFSVFFQYVRIEEALRRGLSPKTLKGILKVSL